MRTALRLAVAAATAALSSPASAAYTCGGASQAYQDPQGTYSFSAPMPDGTTWTGTLAVFDTANGLSHFYIHRTSPPAQLVCVARWNGSSFQALCPPQQGILTHELVLQGTQSNNGFTAVLTADFYTWISGSPHTKYTSVVTGSSGVINRQFTGNPIPCPNSTPVSVGTFSYNWEINGTWYAGTVTTNAQAGSYYEMTLSNPSVALFPAWDGHAFAVLDQGNEMNFYVTTGVPASGPGSPGPWGKGSDTDPIWAWKQWVAPYSMSQYCYSPWALGFVEFLDFFGF